jgi:hypothetical protein
MMSMDLARVRLRGVYAGIAGAFLLIGVPAIESVPLAASGYLTAVDRSASSGDFRYLLAWIAANSGSDGAFRLFELVPFLLAISLPGALALVLWNSDASPTRQAMLWLGRLGFGCYALAAIMGIFSSKSAAAAYLAATGDAGRAQAAAQFAQAYAAQNWIAHVAGGILLAAALALVCARTLRTSRLPMLTAVLELLVAALLLVTALEYAAAPARVEAPTAALAFAVLALWLIAIGIVLWQLRALPAGKTLPAPHESPATTTQDADHAEIETAGASAGDAIPAHGPQPAPRPDATSPAENENVGRNEVRGE